MSDTIMRFVNVHAPFARRRGGPWDDVVEPYAGEAPTPLSKQLLEAAAAGDRGAARGAADAFLREHGPLVSLDSLRLPLGKLDQTLGPAPVGVADGSFADMAQGVLDVSHRSLGGETRGASGAATRLPTVTAGEDRAGNARPRDVPRDLTALREDIRADRFRLADQLCAAVYGTRRTATGRAHLLRGLRLCELLERIIRQDVDVGDTHGVRRLLAATVTMPFAELLCGQRAQPARPLYRLFRENTPDHFYTTSDIHRDSAMRSGYRYEGEACYVYDYPAPGTRPLFQLTNRWNDHHLYTTSEVERDAAIAAWEWVDEGTVCYVFDAPVPGAVPLYRLIQFGALPNYLFTTSSVEREFSIKLYGFGPEGVACYVLPGRPIVAGDIHPAGVADLLVVRQTLRRYERGAIAHVENALKGETRERTHRRTDTTEALLAEETETTSESEHDLQSTGRFELETETNNTIKEDLAAQAGVTVTSNGPVQVTATGSFSYARSKEDATRTATRFAQDVVDRTVTRLKERVLTRRSTRHVLEVEETAKHTIEAPEAHSVGVYRWLDKIYDAQVVNYGKRLMLEFMVPEPAAYFRTLEARRRADARAGRIRREKPVAPTVKPTDITWDSLQALAVTYGASGLKAPPPAETWVSASVEVPHTDREYEKVAPRENAQSWLAALGGSKVSSELKIPEGYTAVEGWWEGQRIPYVRKSPVDAADQYKMHWGELNAQTYVSIAGQVVGFGPGNGTHVKGLTGIIPVAALTAAAGFVMTFRVKCARMPETLQKWQFEAFDAIWTAYAKQLSDYEDALSAADTAEGRQFDGRNGLEYREIERTELKRSAISLLTTQYFDAFGAVSDADPSDSSRLPTMDFALAAFEGNIVQYFEQVFEWSHMTYLFYPYFWGRKSGWPEVLMQTNADAIFGQFLKAGYARVQVPVRPGYENHVLYYLCSSDIWQDAEGSPVDPQYVPLVDEIRNQAGDDFEVGPGTVTVQRDQATVTGTGTKFHPDDDLNREIRIDRVVYRIAAVLSPTSIEVAPPYRGADAKNLQYGLGPVLVGPAWEVKLPTTLVMIDDPNIVLPTFPER